MSKLFYLQDSRGYVGNCMSWWAINGGYTTNLSNAEVFSRDGALKRHANRKTDIPWPKEYIDQRAVKTVDMQHVDRDKALGVTTP